MSTYSNLKNNCIAISIVIAVKVNTTWNVVWELAVVDREGLQVPTIVAVGRKSEHDARKLCDPYSPACYFVLVDTETDEHEAE